MGIEYPHSDRVLDVTIGEIILLAVMALFVV